MFKKFVSLVKGIAKKVVNVFMEDLVVLPDVNVDEVEEVIVVRKKPMRVTSPISLKSTPKPTVQAVEEDVVNSKPLLVEEEKEERKSPPASNMSWKQFKEYNNQVNGYLNQRVSSVI